MFRMIPKNDISTSVHSRNGFTLHDWPYTPQIDAIVILCNVVYINRHILVAYQRILKAFAAFDPYTQTETKTKIINEKKTKSRSKNEVFICTRRDNGAASRTESQRAAYQWRILYGLGFCRQKSTSVYDLNW